jgi:DNA polymerase/3'-5' exonuclease PolX
MLVKELIKMFRDMFLLVDELRAMDRNTEVTMKNVPPSAKKYFESISLWKLRGVGPAKAVELWRAGVRLTNLRQHKALLPEAAQLALKYQPLEKIPHEMVHKIYEEFVPKEEIRRCELVGSYRRNKPTSGDVDILYVTSKDDLQRFLDRVKTLHGDRWILYAQGPSKISGFFRSHLATVEVDLWLATRENKHAMLLYATGSREHNLKMRFVAKHKNMKLSQYGLFDSKGHLIPTRTERDIFRLLNIPYRAPEER